MALIGLAAVVAVGDSQQQPPTQAELLSASAELQKGRLPPTNLDLFRRAVQASPADWRAQAMLGLALSHVNDKGALVSLSAAYALNTNESAVALLLAGELRKQGRAQASRAMYQAALQLAPQNAQAYVQLGVLLANENENNSGLDDVVLDDAAVVAWSHAASLAPKSSDAHVLLAERLAASVGQRAGGNAKQRNRAIRHAKKALKLAPALAEVSDAMAAALLAGGTAPANLTRSERVMMTSALTSSIELHARRVAGATAGASAASASGSDAGAGDPSQAGEGVGQPSELLARAHYRFFHLLVADERLNSTDGDTSIGAEAVRHLREAARLRPDVYADEASKLRGWDEAERLAKEAARRDRLDRVRMVDSIKASMDEKRAQEEEDEAVAEEERREGSQRAARRAKVELR